MSDLYTEVGDALHGYACHGRKTRAEALAEARVHFEHVLAGATRNLAAIAEDTIRVAVVRGRYRQTPVEVLTPTLERVTDPCPDCRSQLAPARGGGGGVECRTPGCGYWYCY